MKASKAHTATSAFQAFVLALVIAVALAFVLIPVLPGETPLDVGDVAFTSFEVDGETIVAEGQIVTETSLSLIKGAALLDNDIGLGEIFSGLLIAVLAGAFIGLYLYLFQPPEVNTNRRLVMYGLLVVLWVAGAKVFFSQALPDGDRLYLAYMLPVAAAPMLIAALLDAGLALFTAALLAVVATFAGFYMPDARQSLSTGPMESLQMVTTFLLTGFVGVFAVRNAERMNNYATAGAGVGVMTIVSLFTFWLLLPDKAGIDLVWILGVGLVVGVASVVITMGGAYVLGAVFGVATRVQLMELAQLTHPLLRQLQEKAPGTFHHSVIVGNLAERAADLTGADSLLVRVGCYFHDIGKIAKPGYYIENQMGGQNPHDRLDPAASAKMVSEHVRAGLRITGKYRIPSRVRAFISEHHGTRLVTYFYRKAAIEDPNADAEKFRYPGPKPQTKETAIVMLADSVEAVVRSSKDRSHERIDELVDGVIRERFNEGQLDESDLTMRDLKVIAESFKATLRGIYHERIEYPEPTAGEMQAAGSAASVAFMKPPADPMEMPPP
ncbi:MAG: HDIG domain-containing protein [Chloroflexi bacterium]|nr:HDIG domain-containing protein [Chloroflexota bacterium]MCI0842689.1 HDIG domain-containing protein [Chloroflexota bacterium]